MDEDWTRSPNTQVRRRRDLITAVIGRDRLVVDTADEDGGSRVRLVPADPGTAARATDNG